MPHEQSSVEDLKKPVRNIAVMISQKEAVSHHLKVFDGINLYASEVENWQVSLDMFPCQVLSNTEKTYDGIIARASQELLDKAAEFNIPVINIWYNSPVANKAINVFPNFESVGRQAAVYLLSRGLKRFGFLGLQRYRSSEKILSGFRAALETAGFDCSHCFLSLDMEEGPRQWKEGCDAIDRWISGFQTPIGIYSVFDNILRVLADRNRAKFHLDIPHDMALLGTGNQEAFCESADVSLSSLDLNYSMIGYRAAALLDDLLDGADPPEGPLLDESASLVVRQSTNIIAAEDPLVAAALRYIDIHCDKHMAVQDIAQAVDTTVRTLQRRFVAKLGRSVSDQIEYLRLERFKQLLVKSDESVRQLASRCGFNSYNHLYTAFTRSEGMSPSKFRNK